MPTASQALEVKREKRQMSRKASAARLDPWELRSFIEQVPAEASAPEGVGCGHPCEAAP